ncbi:hypothetical protein K2P96_01750 [Patescibacteria group bacterium]|nr:hypothetical protein [Patescibacteria group bacterium]
MTYNIHPIFVHFPIALLFLYSIVAILPLVKWLPKISWKDIKFFLLVIGFLGALTALYTGDIAKDLVHPNHALVEAHSAFGFYSTCLYGLLLLGELAHFLNGLNLSMDSSLRKFSMPIEKFLYDNIFTKFLCLLGFIGITLTGMLGGIIAYGLSADPLAPLVLHLLGITL